MLSGKTRERHEALVAQMAGRLGLDLEEAHLRGHFPSEERDAAISACMGCAKLGSCEAFLIETEHAEAAPEYCRNAGRFSALIKCLE